MISVKIDTKAIENMLNRIAEMVGDQKKDKIFYSLADVLAKSWWNETFQVEGARRGHDEWQALSEDYLAWKIKNGYSEKPLILTGHLQASAEAIEDYDGLNSLFYGSKVPYAEFHQDPAIEGHPPKREMVFIGEGDEQEMVDFISMYFQKIIDDEEAKQ